FSASLSCSSRIFHSFPTRRSSDLWVFAIMPPWWLTRWAMSGYAVLGLAGVGGLFRWRTNALRRRAAHLEGVVASRTDELRQNNLDRKSTRLNSSHQIISYAVFCLK